MDIFNNPYEQDAAEVQPQEQEGYYDEDLQEYYELMDKDKSMQTDFSLTNVISVVLNNLVDYKADKVLVNEAKENILHAVKLYSTNLVVKSLEYNCDNNHIK